LRNVKVVSATLYLSPRNNSRRYKCILSYIVPDFEEQSRTIFQTWESQGSFLPFGYGPMNDRLLVNTKLADETPHSGVNCLIPSYTTDRTTSTFCPILWGSDKSKPERQKPDSYTSLSHLFVNPPTKQRVVSLSKTPKH